MTRERQPVKAWRPMEEIESGMMIFTRSEQPRNVSGSMEVNMGGMVQVPSGEILTCFLVKAGMVL